MKYVCNLCGYIYDPQENQNISFESLDESWTCPLCGASKSEFSKND